MPKLTIDGKEVEVPKGTRVIEAAKQAGIDIPFYCYHPGLSIAGNCRMCLVEIEKMPRLQIACHMECTDGMVVKTNTEKVKETRKHVLEFLLVNHPLDCPVCDQAGECWLQDYYLNYGAYDSRVNEDKVKKPKAIPVGPHVMLDAERCILCSRCVRFSDEISKTSEFGIVNRGDHAEITVFPGQEVDNPYSGNVVDICPVGALTDRDFRFKMRVWYLETADSICNGCSRGCNIQIQTKQYKMHHAKGERVMRLKPRFNEAVNKWWICDEGRYGYKFHDQNRILTPIKRGNAAHWDEILPEIAKKIQSAQGKIGVLISPQMSNEEIYLAKKLWDAKGTGHFSGPVQKSNLSPLPLPQFEIHLVKPNKGGYQDDFLIRADKNPNSKGAELMGLQYQDKMPEDFEGLIIFGQDLGEGTGHLAGLVRQGDLSPLPWSLFIGSNHNSTSQQATYVLPAATYAETDGTFTNFEGRVQRFERALEPLGESRATWRILIYLARQLGTHFPFDRAEEIFQELALNVEAFKGLNYKQLQSGGTDIRVLAEPMIPKLVQQSALIFHK